MKQHSLTCEISGPHGYLIISYTVASNAFIRVGKYVRIEIIIQLGQPLNLIIPVMDIVARHILRANGVILIMIIYVVSQGLLKITVLQAARR